MSRWLELYRTSPSGKTMFVCKMCGRLSVTPDRTCPSAPEVVAWKMALECAMLEEIEGALIDMGEHTDLIKSDVVISVGKTSSGQILVSWRDRTGKHMGSVDLNVDEDLTK